MNQVIKQYSIHFLTIGICLLAQSLYGQTASLSIEEAVAKAKSNYPGLTMAQLEVDQQKALKKTAWDLGNTQLFTSKEEAGNGQDGVRTIVGIQQQQIDVFGINPKNKLADQRADLAQANFSVSERRLEKAVRLAWIEAFSAKKQHQIYQELDSVFSNLEKAAQLQLETEAISRLEWLALSNRSKQVELNKSQALRDYKSSLESLGQWLGSNLNYSISDSIPETTLIATGDSILQHPEMNFYKQRVEVAEAKIGVSKASFMPQFNAQYGLQQIADQDGFYRYQFGIRIPLFFGPEAGQMQSAKIEKDMAEHAYTMQNQMLSADYKTSVEQYQKWHDSWSYYKQDAIPLANEQLQGAVIALKEGSIDYIRFIQYVKDAIDIKIQASMALENYLKSHYKLQYFIQNN